MIPVLKTYFQKFTKTLLISVLLVLYTSCGKTTEQIGNGLLSDNDHIGTFFTDTLQLHCHSESIDSLYTKGLTTVLLGSIMDPVMGSTCASLFTQLHLSTTNPYFGEAPEIDSVVLQLAYTGYYGDTTTWQTLHVYEIQDELSTSDDYYQFSDLNVESTDWAESFQFQPRPYTTGSVVGNDTLSQAVLRVPLSKSLGEHLTSADSTVYGSSDAFKNFFHGLKISCESVGQGGAICYFNPTSNTVTKLQIYYRETPSTPSEQQRRYDFYITSDDTFFNQYLHDYSQGSSDFVQQVLQNDTALGQEQLYLQSMGGIRCLISFPDLKNWAESLQHDGIHLIVNEAKLVIPVAGIPDTNILLPPPSLAMVNLKSTGTTSLLPDYLEGSNYYGGSYSSSQQNVTFRISEYLQSVISGGEESHGLYLSIYGASYNAQRMVIAGPEAPQDQQLHYEVKYSLIRE